jgi:hypothetical protein
MSIRVARKPVAVYAALAGSFVIAVSKPMYPLPRT